MGVEVYIGHLSGNVSEDEVRKMFSVAGTVESVHLVRNSGSGELRGCGYVRMSTGDEACQAIGLLNGAMLGDSLIVVRDVTKQNAQPAGPDGGRGRRPAKPRRQGS